MPVESEAYFSRLVYYIHFNPQKHGFIEDFKEYPYSSYQSHLQTKTTKLKRDYVLEWFDGVNQYQYFHEQMLDEKEIKDVIIELD